MEGSHGSSINSVLRVLSVGPTCRPVAARLRRELGIEVETIRGRYGGSKFSWMAKPSSMADAGSLLV